MRELLWLLQCILVARTQYLGPPPLLEISPPFLTEELLRAHHIKEINLTLVGGGGGGWHPDIGEPAGLKFPYLTEDWLARVVYGEGRQPLGWDAEVAPYLRPEHVLRRKGGLMLSLQLMGIDGTGWYPAFDVWYEETVMVSAPWWATADNVSAVPFYFNFSVFPSTPRVWALGALIGGSVPVRELQERPHDITLVLEGCDWDLDAGRQDTRPYLAMSRALIGPNDVEMVAGRSGWQLAASGLLRSTRHNASHLTLTIPPLPAYSIESPETVVLTVPAAAMLQEHRPLTNLGYSFVVLATPGRVRLTGTLLHKNASTRRAPPSIAGKTLDLRLVGDTWSPHVDVDGPLRRQLVRDLPTSPEISPPPRHLSAPPPSSHGPL